MNVGFAAARALAVTSLPRPAGGLRPAGRSHDAQVRHCRRRQPAPDGDDACQ